MKRYGNRQSSSNPFLVWTQLALKTSEMLFASSQVIGHRTNRIAAAGLIPNARDRKEFTLMGQEKVEAMVESAQAITTYMVTAQTQLATLAFRQLLGGATSTMSMMTAPAVALSVKGQAELFRTAATNASAILSQLTGSLPVLVHHGLKPIHSRATGNARRLIRL